MTGRDLPLFLRAPRAAGLWLTGILIPLATVTGFVLSYHNLLDWALRHGWPWYFAAFFPLLIDLLVIVGEVILFVAAIDGNTPRRVLATAWAVVLGFTGLSVAMNVSHAATRNVATQVGWGVPPVVLAIALGLGLGELKRQSAKYRQPGRAVSVVPFTDAQSAAQVALAATVAAGNPLSQRQLMTRFGLSRAEESRVRQDVLAGANGHGGGHD